MFRKIIFALIIVVLFSSCSYQPNLTLDTVFGGDAESADKGYKMISVDDLESVMNEEEITLINVHIPLEGNISETDLAIPFDEVDDYLDQLPQDKDEKIVIYCRSGGMGDTASETLVKLGYTNVWNLDGGYNTWKAVGLPFEE